MGCFRFLLHPRALALCLVFLTLRLPAAAAAADLFTLHPNQIYLTLSENRETRGETLTPDNSAEYVNRIFRRLLSRAHRLAKEYREAGNSWTYYSFLMAALTVPEHESSLVHFRTAPGSACDRRANLGLTLRALSPSAYGVFESAFRSELKPAVPECAQVEAGDSVTQLLASGTFADLGIMQINLAANPGHAASGDIFDLDKTIELGLTHLYRGFTAIRRNFLNYPCLIRDGRYLDFAGVIRGAWSGSYNSGNNGQTCRFANPDSSWAASDDHFARTLANLTRGAGSIFDQNLGPEERAALDELVADYRGNLNRHEKLDRVLEEEAARAASGAADPAFAAEAVPVDHRVLAVSRLWIRGGDPSQGRAARICGQLEDRTGLRVPVLGVEGEWAEIDLRGDSAFVDADCRKEKRFFVLDSLLMPAGESAIDLTGVARGRLQVRQSYPQGAILRILRKGDELRINEIHVSEMGGVWYRIAGGGGAPSGWVYGPMVDVAEGAGP